ncbi:hypothetical protein D9M68_581390 [compost metagenome]
MDAPAPPLGQPFAGGQDDGNAGLRGQFARQRHGVGHASEKRGPDAVAHAGRLVGQHAHGFSAAQRAHEFAHALHGGRHGVDRRAVARGFQQRGQDVLARRAEHDRHGHLAGQVAGGDLEAAQVGRQEEDAPVFGAGGADHVVVVRHDPGQAVFIAEPDPRAFEDHGADFARRAPREGRGGVARLGGVGLEAPPVLARPGVDRAPGEAPQGVRDG